MKSAFNLVTPPRPAYASAIEDAIGAIAPNWPLDRQIAVNPYWGFIDRPFDQAAATLGRLVASRFTLAPSEYLSAWRAGEITQAALARALADGSASVTLDSAVASLQIHRPPCTGLPLISDILDERATPGAAPRWRDTITQQVSQYCASHFDEHQADWRRGQAGGLFRGWRGNLESDHALEPLMHTPEIRARVRDLPVTADGAITWSLERLGVPPEEASELLQVCLLRINGWASWCSYLDWEAGLRAAIDPNLRELLAIRVAWEALLLDDRCDVESLAARWRERWKQALGIPPSPLDQLELIWQRAHEISYQDRLVGLLTVDVASRSSPRDDSWRAAQLVFCIDVRSERFRRALESVDPALETRGFAGFFGLPIRYTPIGTQMSRPQLPGLLAPTLDATESTGDAGVDEAIARRRVSRLESKGCWQPFQRQPSGAFSLVETLGIGYVSAILRRHFGADASPLDSIGMTTRDARGLRPRLCLADADSVSRKADLVTSILRTMSLTSGFARLLVLVGHGSQSANNPQAAALDCGACGGQTGEVNSRVLAGLLNDQSLREALRTRGLDIPEDTVVVAAMHNTTTDEVTLFDVAELPKSHAADLERLQRSLVEAGHRTRLERAPSLGMTPLPQRADALLKQVRRRARDWAETRPEWGLADNAAFIVAPRSRTRGLDLAGRSFLHDYIWADDHDGAVLELIMTAPMLVTHWINLQYLASTVDPKRFGSGNKVLHNVACGRIGVFEGNTGDLRIGLSRQSVHDGERWMHAPLRLSVFVDAPREMIDIIIARHLTVRQLVEHQWLYLFRFADAGIERRHEGIWQAWEAQSVSP
ncbi:MAG: DUF2309 domain-containing protein [Pseudomonadota bacterium]